MEKDLQAAEAIISAKSSPDHLFQDSSFNTTMALVSLKENVGLFNVKEPTLGLVEHNTLFHWRPHELDASEYLVTGNLSHSAFIGAIGALLNASPAHLDVLFSISRPAIGAHAIRFFKDSKWKLITVDDRLPFSLPASHGQLAFAHVQNLLPTSQGGFLHAWVALLEKAFAKMYGTYERIDVPSLVSENLYTLTGVPVLTRLLAPALESEEVGDKLWSDIKKRLLAGNVVVALRNEKTPDDCGVAVAVPYTVLGAASVDDGHARVCVLRPALGCPVWKGVYARDSAEFAALPETLRKMTNVSPFAFAISFEQLLKRFTEVYLMEMPIPGVRKIRSFTAQSQWAGASAGGSLSNQETWKNNPQFSLMCESECEVTVVLSQLDSMADRFKYMSIGCVAAKTPDMATRKINIYADELVASTGSFANKRDTAFCFHASAHQPYVLVPSTYQPGKEGPFFLRICCTEPIEFRDLSSEPVPTTHQAAQAALSSMEGKSAPTTPTTTATTPTSTTTTVTTSTKPSTLKCSECGKLIESSYFERPLTKTVVCPECYEKTATVCPVCKQLVPVGIPARVFQEVRYHTACFHCQQCNHLFGDKVPTVVDGTILCFRCSQPCAECGKLLGAGKVVCFNDKEFHETCLICCECKQVLPADGDILMLDDKPICSACAEKAQAEDE